MRPARLVAKTEHLEGADCEHLTVGRPLDTRNNVVIGYYKLGSGGTTSCVVDAKMIYTIALNSTASSIILAHNHPSGSLKPSEPDKALTNKLIEAGKLLDIALLDHLIITNDSHFSMADEGVI